MIPFTLDKKKYNLPTCWEDVTLSQFMELKAMQKDKDKDPIRFLSIMMGVPYLTLSQTSEHDIIEKIEPFLSFANTPIQKTDCPKTININGVEYQVPTNLKQFTLAQKIAAWSTIEKAIEENKDEYFAIPFVVACYLYPLVQKPEKYSSDEAQKFADEVLMNQSCVPIYHIGTFFLNAYWKYRIKKEPPYPLNQIKNKWLRGYVNSVYLKKSIRLMRSQEAIY